MFFSPSFTVQAAPPSLGGKEIWHAGDFLQGLSNFNDSLGQDRAWETQIHEGHGKLFVLLWQNEGLGGSVIIHQAMKARSWIPEEGWSLKGSPGRDDPFSG